MVLCNTLLPDNTIGLVMDTIQRSGKPFVAIYTEMPTEKVSNPYCLIANDILGSFEIKAGSGCG